MTLDSISELVVTQIPINSMDSVTEDSVRHTRRNKGAAATAVDGEPVKRSARIKASAKTMEKVREELAASPQSCEIEKGSNKPERKEEESISLSDVQTLVIVKVPTDEGHLLEQSPAEKLPQPSPSCCAPTLTTSASGGQASPSSSSLHSMVVRRSLADLRNSMTKEAARRASQRSFLRKKARLGNSTCSSSISGDASVNKEPEDNDKVVADCLGEVVTMETPAADSNAETEPAQAESGHATASKRAEAAMAIICTPKKKRSPPKCLTDIAPGMRSFLHAVQKNQLLMMTPSSLGRTSVMKSFVKQSGKLDVKLRAGSVERERLKYDALNKKIELENERKKKLEEERRRKQEEIKKKHDERLRRVVEARVKVEKEKEQEKRKKIEEKMAQMEKKSDLLRVERLAEEKAKTKVASKRQEEMESRRKQEVAQKKKLQQAQEVAERRHLELLAKRKAEEEREKAHKQAEAARALELKKEQEKEREREREKQRDERERERQAVAERERLERERVEQEKAIALQKELERVAKEKERQALEEKRRKEKEQKEAEEEKLAKQKYAAASTTTTTVVNLPLSNTLKATIPNSPALNVTVDIEQSAMKTPVGKGAAQKTVDKGAGLNVTVDLEQSPQSYQITPKGKKVTALVNPEDYGMNQNSDDSTDDESAPRKPIPSWAEGMQLQQAIMTQFYDPLDLHSYFGDIEQPKLEKIFLMSKPRFFKRTSSAVWHSPPRMGAMSN